jgi:flagellar hook-length control protein FliK
MATVSPSALSAVPDRPMAERPETRGSDASDGQFAGLMAQFVQTPATTRTPSVAPNSPAKVQKKPPVKASQVQPADEPASPRVSTGSSRKAERPDHKAVAANAKADAPKAKAGVPDTKADASDDKADSSTAKADALQAMVEDVNAKVGDPNASLPAPNTNTDAPPPQLNASNQTVSAPIPAGLSSGSQGPDGAQLQGASPALAGSPVAPLPPELTRMDEAEKARGTQSASIPDSLPPPATTASATIQITGMTPAASAAGPSPEVAGLLTASQAKPEGAPSIPPSKEETPSMVQVPQGPAQAGPMVDSVRLEPPVVAQAVLAEPSPRLKAANQPESALSASDALDIDALPATTQATKAIDTLTVPPPPNQTPVKALANPAPLLSIQEPTAGSAKATAQLPANAESVLAWADALAPESAPMAPTLPPLATDGSALAALNAHARVAETAPVAAPVPLAAATPPTAPVLQVEGGLRWMLKGGAQEAQLQLHPDSLGQVTIHLRVEGGEVHARLWITEPGSVQAVQEGRPHLEMSLKEQGLQLGSFDLQQGHRPFQEAPTPSTFRDRPALEAVSARQEAPAALPVSILNPHHVELYA